jgi:primosomal protein N' (replication factor Y)
MDRDTTQKRGSHEEIYYDFSKSRFDILIGTQMIAKGWDLPNVELVGIISADTMINLPDFRSAERTFSLLTQVAGRTGRGFHPGKVILQTYNPDNYAVVAAAKHDYLAFYNQEIESRKKYGYPPYSSLVKLTYAHPDAAKAEKEAQATSERLTEQLAKLGVVILGPSPCFIEKMAGKYRFQLVIKIPTENFQTTSTKHQTNSKSQNTRRLKTKNLKFEILDILKQNIKPGWSIDVDPESLL